MSNSGHERPSSVGFIGLGRMGAPMASNLLAAGHRVSGYDPDPNSGASLDGVPGFRRAESAADAGRGAAVVILMLPNSDVVEHVLEIDGLLDAVEPGASIVDMSSSEPVRTRQLAERVAATGATLIDAPVSGGVQGAKSASLVIMVGGPSEQLVAVEPLLRTMGSRVTRVGEVGSGHAVKALNNLMSATHLLITAEAMSAARRFDLDPNLALEVINGSSGRSGSTEAKWPKFVLSGAYDSGFALRLMVKDMRIAVELEQEIGNPSPLSESALAIWESAAEELPDDADHTEIARWLDERRSRAEAGSR